MADTYDDKEDRSPEEIEREIAQTRAEISHTIDAIANRFSANALVDQAINYVRSGSGAEFGKSLGTAVIKNPLPVALIGLGLAWLAIGGGRMPAYMTRRRVSGPHDESYRGDDQTDEDSTGGGTVARMGDAATQAGSYARSGVQHAADQATRVGRSVSGAASSAGRGIRDTGQRLGEAASGVGHRMGEMASGASERVRQMSEDVRNLAYEWSEGAVGVAESAGEQAIQAATAAQERAMQMRQSANDLLRDQPLVVGALGLAVGAVLGAVMPLTRRENELMGETRDQFLEQAKEQAQHVYAEAKDVVSKATEAATETAKQESERRGLTPDKSGDTARGNTGSQGGTTRSTG